MKAIGYAVAILGLAAAARASTSGLPGAAPAQQTFEVQITATPTVAVTNAYLLYGTFYFDEGNYYAQNAFGAVPIGTLPATTSASPDVVTVSIPQIYITDPAYSGQPVLPNRAVWSIEGLYAPGGVSVTNTDMVGANGGWPYMDASESSVATALANGDVNTLLDLYPGTAYESASASGFGYSQPLIDYSSATPNGSVNAVLNPATVPEPTSSMLLLGFGAVSLLRRRR